jgi:hypothetical protein
MLSSRPQRPCVKIPHAQHAWEHVVCGGGGGGMCACEWSGMSIHLERPYVPPRKHAPANSYVSPASVMFMNMRAKSTSWMRATSRHERCRARAESERACQCLWLHVPLPLASVPAVCELSLPQRAPKRCTTKAVRGRSSRAVHLRPFPETAEATRVARTLPTEHAKSRCNCSRTSSGHKTGRSKNDGAYWSPPAPCSPSGSESLNSLTPLGT